MKGEQNQDFRHLSKLIKKIRYTKALDIGCGSGLYLSVLDNYIGIDISKKTLKKTKRRFKNLILADARYLPFKDNIFDLIISIEVITHINKRDWEKIFKEISRVSKRNAFLILSLHNKKRYNLDITKGENYEIYWTDENEIIEYISGFRIIKILYVNLLPQRFQRYEFYITHKLIFKFLSIIEDILVKFPLIKNYALEFVIIGEKI